MEEMTTCALCDAPTDSDCFCFGCKRYVCDNHQTLFGSHDLYEHEVADFEADDSEAL